MSTSIDIESPAFIAVLEELESLAKDFSVSGQTPGYEQVWTPDGTIRMWSVPRPTGRFLYDSVLQHKPKVILELGTSSGYSTLWMGAAAATYGGHVYTIEVAQPKIDIAQSYIDRVGLHDHISIVPGMIADVLTTWTTPIDLVFLDADKMNYLSYMLTLEPFIAPGGTIIADNVLDFADLMRDFLDYMRTSGKYTTEVLTIDHGLLVAR